MEMAYIYMVRCTDSSLYTGIAKNVGQRMREHYYKKKSGAKYTKSRQIRTLEMVWETDTWSHAAKLEFRIKKLTHQQKEELLRHPKQISECFGEELDGIVYEPHPELELSMFLDKDQ
jgi:putative endonuclease